MTQKQARTGRLPEAILLVIAVGVGVGAYCLTYSTSENTGPPPNLPMIIAISVLIAALAHVVVRTFAPYADPVFLPCGLALNGLGLAVIHRIDIVKETTHANNQAMLTVGAIFFMVVTVVLIRNHRTLRKYTWTSLAAGIFLLLLPMAPGLGRTINGARIWIRLPGFSFQPAELAKICFAVFFAGYLVAERDNLSLAGKKIMGIQLPKARHFVPILLAWAACMAVLVLERDFGTALLFFGLFVGMLYVATERPSWIAIGGALAFAGIFVIVQVMPHIQARFTVWLHALDNDVYNEAFGSYQLVQGLFGMASGGIFGTGLGEGYPERVYAADSDFIIASIGEELGLVGLLSIICLYLIIVVRGLRTAIVLKDGFGKLLVTGLAFTIAIQCFVVVGGVTRLIPLTGLAMPFLAHGGSALLANWIIIGLLLRISDTARRPAEADPLPPPEVLDSIPSLDKGSDSTENDSLATQVVKL
ncbi:MAG: FtsW/RodA/SpoVE family cell cycle protein [Actinomycetaceae bacterium]|nr:FtsW/RodA/SpoVE family cell cycle protein [Actinomycetaceae bacterium]